MAVQGLGFLPILWVAWTFLGFITLYVLTIHYGHAESYLLYISETGDYFPESLLFMVVFVVTAVLDAFLSYCMYKYYAVKSSGMQHCYPTLQTTILGIGWIACVGTVIIAILPAVTYPVPHRIAAVVSFLGSAVRNTCQAILLHKLAFNSQRMCHLRMSISILTVLSLVILFFSRLIWWQICSGSLCLHVTESIAIITEWIGATGLLVYKLTHYTDFQELAIKWHCGLTENWLFLRDNHQETWNSHYSDWWAARPKFLIEHMVQPLLFYVKPGLHISKKENTKLIYQNYPKAVPLACITHMRPSSLGFVEAIILS